MIWVMKATLYFRGHGTSLDITDTPTINKIISRHDKKIKYGQDLKTSSLLPPLEINRGSERKNWSNVQQSIEFKSCWLFLSFDWLWKPSGLWLSVKTLGFQWESAFPASGKSRGPGGCTKVHQRLVRQCAFVCLLFTKFHHTFTFFGVL